MRALDGRAVGVARDAHVRHHWEHVQADTEVNTRSQFGHALLTVESGQAAVMRARCRIEGCGPRAAPHRPSGTLPPTVTARELLVSAL